MGVVVFDCIQPKPGYTYRVFYDGKEVEHFHCTGVKGRRIRFGMTAWSSLYEQTTRLRWEKMVNAIYESGGSISEEAT